MSTPTTPTAPAAAAPTPTPAPENKINAEMPDEKPVVTDDAEVDPAAEAAALEAEEKEEAAKKETKKEAAARKKKFQLKVDGKDEEMEIDLDNEEEVRKHLQMSKAAYKRMQEMAEYKKNVMGLIETLKTDPLKVLADPRLGIPEETRKKLAESIINNEIEEMNKTPEQKEKERLQREYEALKKQHEEEKKAREQEKFRILQEQAAKDLDNDITSAIESSGLPKTSRTVKIMAEAMMFALENNLELSAKELVPYVKKQTLNEFKEMISSLPDEEFENWLGKDQITRIRKRSLQKLKQSAPTPEQVKPTGSSEKKKVEEKEATKQIPLRDFLKTLGR